MGLINWIKDKRISEMQYDIKKLNQEIELLQTSFDNLKMQVNSIRTLVYRRKYGAKEEKDEEEMQDSNNDPIDLQKIQRQLLGFRD